VIELDEMIDLMDKIMENTKDTIRVLKDIRKDVKRLQRLI